MTGGGNFNVAGGTITGNLNLGTSNMSMGGASLVGWLDGTAGTISGNATKAITLTFGSDNTATHAYGGNIVNGTGGSLAVVKAGSGKMTLTGANTYSGGTTVQDGTLAVVVDGSLGTGTVTVSTTGTLQYTGSTTATRSFVLGSSILPGGNMVVNAGQTLTVNGGSIVGGTLNGPGTFATDPINGARFANDTGAASAAITSNSPSDRFINFSNSGAWRWALPARRSPSTGPRPDRRQVDGWGGEPINIANFQSTGTVTLVPAVSPQTTLITNLGSSPLTFAAGSRTFVGTPPDGAELRGRDGHSRPEFGDRGRVVREQRVRRRQRERRQHHRGLQRSVQGRRERRSCRS